VLAVNQPVAFTPFLVAFNRCRWEILKLIYARLAVFLESVVVSLGIVAISIGFFIFFDAPRLHLSTVEPSNSVLFSLQLRSIWQIMIHHRCHDDILTLAQTLGIERICVLNSMRRCIPTTLDNVHLIVIGEHRLFSKTTFALFASLRRIQEIRCDVVVILEW